MALASACVAILGRQLEKTSTALESLQEKMMSQAVPAIERGTMAGQAMQPVIQQNAEAMGAMTEATKAQLAATTELVGWVRVLEDREDRRPPPRRRTP